MQVSDIPQELLDILDERAGKRHSREGSVVRCLAEILTRYDEMRQSSEDGESAASRVTPAIVCRSADQCWVIASLIH